MMKAVLSGNLMSKGAAEEPIAEKGHGDQGTKVGETVRHGTNVKGEDLAFDVCYVKKA